MHSLTRRPLALVAALLALVLVAAVALANSQTGAMSANLTLNSATNNGNGTWNISVTAQALGGSNGAWDFVFGYRASNFSHPAVTNAVHVTRATRIITTTLTVSEACTNPERTEVSVEIIGSDGAPAWAQVPLDICL